MLLLDLDEKLKKLPLLHLKDIARRHNDLLHINITQNKPQIIKSIITHYKNYWNDADASMGYRMQMKPHLENIFSTSELLNNTYIPDKKKISKAAKARAAAALVKKPVKINTLDNILSIFKPEPPPAPKRKPGRPKKTEIERDNKKISKINEHTEMLNYIHKSRPDIIRKKIIEE